MSTLAIENIGHTNGTTAMTISSAGTPNFTGLPCFHVTKNTDQTLSDAVTALVTFESVTDGDNGGRTINKLGLYGNNRFTVTEATTGIYYVYCNIWFQGNQNVGDFHMYYKKNGTDTQQVVYANAGAFNNLRYGTYQNNQILNLSSAGDYIELYAYADMASGGQMVLNHNSVNIQRTNMGGYKVA
tara:strand:- start:551 stop:1105 length:555 start_codon:yes stop_codon:yes gene_type:complete